MGRHKVVIHSRISTKVAAVILFVLTVSIVGCSQTSTQTTTNTANKNSSKPAAPTNSKIAINAMDMGTTKDPSQLTKLLTNVFKERREQLTLKPGTTDVEADVFLKAEPSTGLPEVLKMVDVIRHAGSSAVLLPIELSLDEAKREKPNPLTLLVTIGERDRELTVFVEGIELINGPEAPHADKDTLPKEFVAVFVPKDGEYVVGEKHVGQPALANELRSRAKQLTESKRLYLIVDGDGDVRYKSLREAALAAHAVGAKEVYIITLKD